jgi:hypothetical protein
MTPIEDLLRRVRAEYLEMPGLRLTLPQAQRLWGVDERTCMLVLDTLTSDKFLCRRGDGKYLRQSEEPASRSRMAKADQPADPRPRAEGDVVRRAS